MTAGADRRVFFVGDSYVVGVGDPAHLGWVGRLAARSHAEGAPVTAYNLGVRRDTGDDVLRRWAGEVAVRRAAGAQERMVVAFGVNDAARGLPPDRSAATLRALAGGAAAAGLPLLVVGPPPVGEAALDELLAVLDARFAEMCAQVDVPYVPVFAELARWPRWAAEVAAGDGAHPAAAGCARLAELVAPVWRAWLAA